MIENQTPTTGEKQSLPRLAYKVSEAAVILGVNPFTIYRLIERGKLKACSVLRHKLIPAAELERFLAQ